MRKLTVIMLTFVALAMSLTATGAEWTIAPAPEGLPEIRMYKSFPPQKSLCEWEYYRYPDCPKKAIKGQRCKLTPKIVAECFPLMPWEDLLETRLRAFQEGYSTWLSFVCDNSEELCDRVKVLRLRGLNPLPVHDLKLAHYKAVKPVLKKLFKSPKKLKAIYGWAMPPFKKIFVRLPPEDREFYMDIFQYALKYTRRFSWKKELRYLRRLQRRHRVREFTKKSSTGKASHFREVEAFIFRRVRDGMPIRIIRKWILRIIADLRPLVKKE